MDLDAKLILSNKLVDELKCENESLEMHAKCLNTELFVKKDENICCNHVVMPDFIPNVSFISKDKSVYIPSHKGNQKVERKALKPKPLFRSTRLFGNGSTNLVLFFLQLMTLRSYITNHTTMVTSWNKLRSIQNLRLRPK